MLGVMSDLKPIVINKVYIIYQLFIFLSPPVISATFSLICILPTPMYTNYCCLDININLYNVILLEIVHIDYKIGYYNVSIINI